ncbi:MAG: response regulator [Alphaproteobacteria bacterium]
MPNSASQKYILVVDDDPTMQLILQGMIEKAGFKPVIAENGEKAIQFIEVGGANIAVVLLDRHLPDMDGLEVVKKIHAIDGCADTQIIMQSGSKEPKDIREAIESGVFYYLTKPFKIEALQNALNFAIGNQELRSVLQDRLSRGYAPVNLLRSSSFEFSKMEDARKMTILLASFFPEPFAVFSGISALLSNAVQHGSCGLGFDGKTALLNAPDYKEAFSKLEEANADKSIEVQFIQKDGRFSIRVTDQGKGFDWKSWSAFEEARDDMCHGYGVLKALRCFDEVKYNTAGNQVMASIYQK